MDLYTNLCLQVTLCFVLNLTESDWGIWSKVLIDIIVCKGRIVPHDVVHGSKSDIFKLGEVCDVDVGVSMDTNLRLWITLVEIDTVLPEGLEIIRAAHVFECGPLHLALNWSEVVHDIVRDRVSLLQSMVSLLLKA